MKQPPFEQKAEEERPPSEMHPSKEPRIARLSGEMINQFSLIASLTRIKRKQRAQWCLKDQLLISTIEASRKNGMTDFNALTDKKENRN